MQLTKEQYWKWMHKIEQMKHAETAYRAASLQFGMLEKDLEIQKLRMSLFKNQVQSKKDEIDLKKAEYELIKQELETDLGISLNNTVIDEVSLEVKKLED